MVQLSPHHPHVNLRLKFKKVGSLQYISHLDLVRTMYKIIVRAKLPLWYTEGFNPKPKMIFAAPLSIGVESVCEYLDIKLIDDIPPEEAMRRLNENMTDEMQIIEAYYTEDKLTDLKWLGYELRLCPVGGVSEELVCRVRETLLGESLTVEKKGKPQDKPKTVDIRHLIHSALVSAQDGELLINCILSADSSSFLNPEYIIKALRDKLGILTSPVLTDEYYSILRNRAYRADMTPFA